MFNITVLTLVDRIASFYSLSPFFNNTDGRFRFTWTDDPQWCLEKDSNRILVLMRQFIKPDRVDLELMKKLRSKYDRIAFFHDDAGGGIPRIEVLPYVDLFYNKALYKDRSLYGKSLYGKELYSNYYHETYGITDPDHRERPVLSDPSQLDKLRLSWNIGIGEYPRTKWKQRIAVALGKRLGPGVIQFFRKPDRFRPDSVLRNTGAYPVHARLGLISRPSISYQRTLILERIKGHPGFLTGSVSQKRFNHETKHSKIVLSPFGWGELCLRDFETVRGGALLLKPDMSHIDTWPDIFLPGVTYVPFGWNGEDLLEKASYYLEHEDERIAIVKNAAHIYKEQLDGMQSRFSAIMGEICTGEA